MEEIKGRNKPKLLFVVTEDWYFVSHRLPLAVGAIKSGFDVSVATRARNHVEIIEKSGIRLIPFEMSRRVGNPLMEFLGLLFLYRRERPDIVHHIALKPVFLGSFAFKLAGLRSQVNAVAGLGWLFISQSRLARMVSPLIRWTLAYLLRGPSCKVIVQNPDDAGLLQRAGVPASNLKMIRGAGVNTNEFLPSPEPSGPISVVLATRILWDKGVGEFVEAARLLKQRGVEARFILVGDPDPDNPASVPELTLQEWKEENVVELWGHRDDMAVVFQSAHVVCLPSYREGLPKVLIEAASCARPIVTTDVPGCREVVSDGDNGFLVPVRNVPELSNALLRLIESSELRAKMGKRSREIATKEFSLEMVIGQTLDLYKEQIE